MCARGIYTHTHRRTGSSPCRSRNRERPGLPRGRCNQQSEDSHPPRSGTPSPPPVPGMTSVASTRTMDAEVGERCPRRSTHAEADAQRLGISPPPRRRHPPLALLTPAPTPEAAGPPPVGVAASVPTHSKPRRRATQGSARWSPQGPAEPEPASMRSLCVLAGPAQSRPFQGWSVPRQAGPSSGLELTACCRHPLRVLPLGARVRDIPRDGS